MEAELKEVTGCRDFFSCDIWQEHQEMLLDLLKLSFKELVATRSQMVSRFSKKKVSNCSMVVDSLAACPCSLHSTLIIVDKTFVVMLTSSTVSDCWTYQNWTNLDWDKVLKLNLFLRFHRNLRRLSHLQEGDRPLFQADPEGPGDQRGPHHHRRLHVPFLLQPGPA